MTAHRLLYLSTHRMTAYRWRSGVLEVEGAFATNDGGHQQFSDYIKQQRRSTFALLANVAEEGFHLETIPFLQGKDRQTVITRKLGQGPILRKLGSKVQRQVLGICRRLQRLHLGPLCLIQLGQIGQSGQLKIGSVSCCTGIDRSIQDFTQRVFDSG